MPDLVIRGGTVIDGTGSKGQVADIAIEDGHIVAIGNLSDEKAKARINRRIQMAASPMACHG